MTWTLPSLVDDLSSAWTLENLPYTIAFWAALGLAVWLLNRRRPADPPEEE